MSFSSLKRGFTLIELLLVIGIIAILAAIVIVAINPTKQLGDARNAQRRADVNTILNAVYQYTIDNNGNLPKDVSGNDIITTTATNICRSGVDVNCTGLINLNVLTGSYVVAIPADPKSTSTTDTNYSIVRAGNRITVAAPLQEQGAVISVTR